MANSDITESNYVELISVDEATVFTMCNDKDKAVDTSLPRILSGDYQACDEPKQNMPLTDNFTTNVGNVPGTLIPQQTRPSVGNTMAMAVNLLGNELNQDVSSLNNQVTAYVAPLPSINFQKFSETVTCKKNKDKCPIDLHFVDASSANLGTAPGRALMQVNKALMGGGYDYRIAISKTRSTPDYIGFYSGRQYYKASINTIKGFWDNGCVNDSAMIDKYAAILSEPVNTSAINIIGISNSNRLVFGTDNQTYGNLANLAISSIVRSTGYSMSIALTSAGSTTSGGWKFDVIPATGLALNPIFNTTGSTGPLDYRALINSIEGQNGLASNDFSLFGADLRSVQPSDHLRFRQLATKIFCVFIDDIVTGYSLDDNFQFIDISNGSPDKFDAFRQAIQCGHKFLFILKDDGGAAAQELYNFITSVGLANASMVVVDANTAVSGEYFDRLIGAVNTLCGYVGENVIPGVSEFGSLKQVWQGNSVLSIGEAPALSNFKVNETYLQPDVSPRIPTSFSNIPSLHAYDPVFDRSFYITDAGEEGFYLNAIYIATRERVSIAKLPYLFASENETESNMPSALSYDPGMRLLFIGTDSGSLYSVNVKTGKSSGIQVRNINVVPKSERTQPTITSIKVGYVPTYDYNNVSSYTGHRALFVGFNVMAVGFQNISRYTIIRSYVYDVDIFNKTGRVSMLTPDVSIDFSLVGVANPRSMSFLYAPVMNFPLRVAPVTPEAEFVANQKLPALLVCHDYWNDDQTEVLSGSGRCIALNPMIFNRVFASSINMDKDILTYFPVPAYYLVTDRADYVAIDDFGGSVVWSEFTNNLGEGLINYYYVSISPSGVSPTGEKFLPSTSFLLNTYKAAENINGLFIRDSQDCSAGVKGVERNSFNIGNLNCWAVADQSGVQPDAFVGNELILRYGQSISKNYNLGAGKYFVTVTTSDYRTGADDAGVNYTGLVDIITSGGSRFHYIPATNVTSSLDGLRSQKIPTLGIDPTVITTAGTVTYVFDMPDSFSITLRNSIKPDTFKSLTGGAFMPEGAGINGIRICKLIDKKTVTAGISDVRLSLSFKGIPREEVNLFSAFVKITYRDYGLPTLKKTEYRLAQIDGRSSPYAGKNLPPDCDYSDTCNYWKQNGNAGIATQFVLNQKKFNDAQYNSYYNNKIIRIDDFANCVWCIPAGALRYDGPTKKYVPTDLPDVYTIRFGDFKSDMIVEAIEYFVLMNRIFDVSNTPPSCDSSSAACGPDPVTMLDVHLDYINCEGNSKRLSDTINLNALVPNIIDLSRIFPTSRWDYIRPAAENGVAVGPPLGNAVIGEYAEWRSIKKILDDIAGTGLDQCSSPLTSTIVYNGSSISASQPSGCHIPTPRTSAYCVFAKMVIPEFVIVDISSTTITNETQLITVPSAANGTYKLVFAKNGITNTIVVPHNATAAELKKLLEAAPLIGTGNVLVSGTDEFIVEFVGALKGIILPIMKPNSNQLVGTYYAYTGKIATGTVNERQTISNVAASSRGFALTFNGQQTVTIPYNASLNMVRNALFALPTIGIDNVAVTGDIIDPNAAYTGPWRIDFIGSFSNSNVPRLTSSNKDYLVYVDWVGGVGVNEKQYFTYKANSGNFSLTLYGPTGLSCKTASIAYNASAIDIAQAITAACSFYKLSDISLSSVVTGNVYKWTIEYKGVMSGRAIKQLNIESIDLVGDGVTVSRIQAGGGSPQKIKWTYKNALAGYYILKFQTIDNRIYFSDKIYYNSTAADIQRLLEAMTLFSPGDIVVTQNDVGVLGAYEYVLTIKKNISAMKVTAIYETTLKGSPITYFIVPDGPYDYPMPYCDSQAPLIHGVDGLICVPYPPDESGADSLEPCCTFDNIPDEKNRSTFFRIERDLFDPAININGKPATVGSLMAARNYRKSRYKPYYLVSGTCVDLIEANYTDTIKNRTIIVLIDKNLDAGTPKKRIIDRIKSNKPRLDYCRALSFERGKPGKDYPDILPGKNYNT